MSGGHLFSTDRSGTERLSMGKKDRTGNRKTRDQRKRFKVPELGYSGIAGRCEKQTCNKGGRDKDSYHD